MDYRTSHNNSGKKDAPKMNESAIVTYKRKIISFSRGKPCEVEFKFNEIWAFKKATPDFDPKHLAWFHVHPVGFGIQPSSTDLNCVKGLHIALGSVGGFCIICFKDKDLNNIEGEGVMYQFDGKELKIIEEGELGEDPFGWILKALAVA